MHQLRRNLAWASLLYFRHELPGWRRLSAWVGLPIGNEAQWDGTPPRVVRGKLHGMLMRVHFQDWCERLTYFLGRYYELPLELLLRALLRRGDTFVDVGANVGMVTLMAASTVGEDGTIIAFEPNPALVERLRDAVSLNRLGNVTLIEAGLSDVSADLPLLLFKGANGWSTFAPAKGAQDAHETIHAKVIRGDDALRSLAGTVTVKIDVEGFECRVLAGMASTIAAMRPAIITEIDAGLLHRAGGSPREIECFMKARDYRGFWVVGRRDHFEAQLVLEDCVDISTATSANILWVHPGGAHFERIRSYVADGSPC